MPDFGDNILHEVRSAFPVVDFAVPIDLVRLRFVVAGRRNFAETFLRGRQSRGGGASSWPHRQYREFECETEIRTRFGAWESAVRFSSYNKKPRFTAVRHDELFSSCVA
jgi:hypothetical protein